MMPQPVNGLNTGTVLPGPLTLILSSFSNFPGQLQFRDAKISEDSPKLGSGSAREILIIEIVFPP